MHVLDDEEKNILSRLLDVSRMPDVPKEFTHLDKAEEELEECLIEIRRLKNHFNEMKAARKDLNEGTKKEAIDDLIKEIGDVYVDLILCLPLVIPEISIDKINERIAEKIAVYARALDRLNGLKEQRAKAIKAFRNILRSK
jgi:hypothetical protein